MKTVKKIFCILLICAFLCSVGCASQNKDNATNITEVYHETMELVEDVSNDNKEIIEQSKTPNFTITGISDALEGSGAVINVPEDPFWTEERLRGDLNEEAPKTMIIEYENESYEGNYWESFWSMGLNFQEDYYQIANSDHMFSVNHDSGKVISIDFPSTNKGIFISEEEAIQIAKEYLEKTEIPIGNLVFETKGSVSGDYLVFANCYLFGVETYGQISFWIDHDGTILVYNQGMYPIIEEYVSFHSEEEIKIELERLCSKEVETEIEKLVLESGYTSYQIKGTNVTIDESGNLALIYTISVAEKEIDEFGTWESSYLTMLVVR